MIATFTLQEKEILCRVTRVVWGGKGEEARGIVPLFFLKKASFSIFLRLFNKSILKQQHADDGARGTETDLFELLKLQNILRPQPWLGQN